MRHSVDLKVCIGPGSLYELACVSATYCNRMTLAVQFVSMSV